MKNKKSLGQHWLEDRQILDAIADLAAGAASVSGPAEDPSLRPPLCLEIGPGLGTLTSSLLKRFDKVFAVEYDQKLAENLPKSFPGKNLLVVNEDILLFDFSKIKLDYVVAGNIPYYITSPIIDKLLSAEPRPKRIVLLIQKEVAERAVARAGKHSILSLSTQNRAEASLGPIVAKEFFTPEPKVDSHVLVLEPRAEPLVSAEVIAFAKLGFSSPRKKLITNLATGLGKTRTDLLPAFERAGLSSDLRPADLTLADWQSLHDSKSVL